MGKSSLTMIWRFLCYVFLFLESTKSKINVKIFFSWLCNSTKHFVEELSKMLSMVLHKWSLTLHRLTFLNADILRIIFIFFFSWTVPPTYYKSFCFLRKYFSPSSTFWLEETSHVLVIHILDRTLFPHLTLMSHYKRTKAFCLVLVSDLTALVFWDWKYLTDVCYNQIRSCLLIVW